ncbi:hypothetical protein [Pontibacter harenae]|uniref:hypothetical protein n=1 Tax=Pontibacter harenae TaxID=2894083 RepID=UPI001E2DB372|nr:hypothetical protein [Pontibacter harenae]MCC9167455.1 hypothetical protein [Pontibacter harenae]
MEELDRLHKGLENSNTLIFKNHNSGITCSFIKEGLVYDSFDVKDQALADVLTERGMNGVVEGSNFYSLKNNYEWFSLSVKSRKLYSVLQ